jgi:LmbE family N-acetylglucosaminyl deacetylase
MKEECMYSESPLAFAYNDLPIRRRSLSSLFGHVLVLVAHPDDETACATLLQRARDATVVFCTDGAPKSSFFWNSYGSAEQYAVVRSGEARRALEILGITSMYFLRDPATQRLFSDQELYRAVPEALTALTSAMTTQLDAIVAPAYEGGHPDHDACSLLAYLVGCERNIPVWEMPLYHRSEGGELVHQQFLEPDGSEVTLCSTARELGRRAEMLAAYASQQDAPNFISASMELFRPQPTYDYCRPPHPGLLNYELWGWPMSATEVCGAFHACLVEFNANRELPRLGQRHS